MASNTLRLMLAISASVVVLDGCAAKFRAVESGGTNADANRDGGDAQGRDIRSIEVNQDDRSKVSELVTQGSAGNDKAENFMQAPGAGVLDILVVVDNSGSMAEEQANLATKLTPLLEHVKNANWRIAVTTTDPSQTMPRAIINKADANAAAAYEAAIRAGTNGSGAEQGIRAAEIALSQPTQWVRQSSTLATLIVSDEDNCSRGSAAPLNVPDGSVGTCQQPYNFTPANHLLFIKDKMNRMPGKDARVYGIVFEENSQATCTTGYRLPSDGVYHFSRDYQKLVADTAGTAGSICAADYTTVLQKISQNIAEILKNQFALAETPSPGTVTVTINGAPTTNFTVAGNVITFNTPPPNGAAIVVSYKTDAGEQKTAFELKDVPVVGTVEVRIDGVLVPSSEYDVDYAGKKITFDKAPPAGKQVAISYRIDSGAPLKTEFQVEKDLPIATMTVLVNGVKVTNYVYDPATGILRFDEAPADGAKIVVEVPKDAGTSSSPSPVPTK